jgi:hypothetical protein
VNLNDAFEFLNFWINKKTGAWFTISELENLVDGGQLAYYSDIKQKYATSQLVKDILSPFRSVYDFTTSNTISGFIVIPSNLNYLDLLDIQIYYTSGGRTIYYPVKLINEDERANRLNSQIDPVTTQSPIGEQCAPGYFRLYPAAGYNGSVTFLRRPVKPVFAYSVISGRVIVYDHDNSTQLEWRQTEIIPVLLKALESIGINLSDQEIAGFAEAKTQSNFSGVNRL